MAKISKQEKNYLEFKRKIIDRILTKVVDYTDNSDGSKLSQEKAFALSDSPIREALHEIIDEHAKLDGLKSSDDLHFERLDNEFETVVEEAKLRMYARFKHELMANTWVIPVIGLLLLVFASGLIAGCALL